MRAIARTEYGAFAVDLDTEEVEAPGDVEVHAAEPLKLALPKVVASAAVGSHIRSPACVAS